MKIDSTSLTVRKQLYRIQQEKREHILNCIAWAIIGTCSMCLLALILHSWGVL